MPERNLKRKDHSTLGKIAYIFGHVYYGTCLAITVYLWLPILVPIAHHHRSILRLVLCMLVTEGFQAGSESQNK